MWGEGVQKAEGGKGGKTKDLQFSRGERHDIIPHHHSPVRHAHEAARVCGKI